MIKLSPIIFYPLDIFHPDFERFVFPPYQQFRELIIIIIIIIRVFLGHSLSCWDREHNHYDSDDEHSHHLQGLNFSAFTKIFCFISRFFCVIIFHQPLSVATLLCSKSPLLNPSFLLVYNHFHLLPGSLVSFSSSFQLISSDKTWNGLLNVQDKFQGKSWGRESERRRERERKGKGSSVKMKLKEKRKTLP